MRAARARGAVRARPREMTGDADLCALLRTLAPAARDEAPRFTHTLHPWPARFDWRLPAAVLARACAGGARPVVLDPFAGSGTTAVEAVAAGLVVHAVDLNPLAGLLCRVKATPLDARGLAALAGRIERVTRIAAGRVRHRHRTAGAPPLPEALRAFFAPHVYWELAGLREGVEAVAGTRVRDCLRAALSAVVVKASRQRRDGHAGLRERALPPGFATRAFAERGRALHEGLRALARAAPAGTAAANVVVGDARDLTHLGAASIDLCVTSPPYAGTYDYAAMHRLRAFWLDAPWGAFEAGEIGARRHGGGDGDGETRAWLAAVARVLRPGGEAYVVVGDGVAGGRAIDGGAHLTACAVACGLAHVGSASVTRPNWYAPHDTAFRDAPRREHLVQLRAPPDARS